MAVVHIVLFKFASPNDSKVAASMKKACEIFLSIPGVTGASAGPNYTQRGKGYNFALVVTFDSKESESKYQTHEEHVRAKKECIIPHLSKEPDPVIALDYVDVAALHSKV
mmetsp:Transcript_5890/g.11146  ORF Transcript_5890/g.11146 Transcript_5890/m.11146 type:complete len:110 (-) Transcript_5890:2-331(-)